MFSAKDYWEERYKVINPETYDYSQSRPSAVLAGFCENYLRNNAVILDLGCGGGRNADYLSQKGYEVYGVDIAEGAVEFCRKRFALHNLSGTFKQGTIDRIPFPDGYFESVICIATMDHVTSETAQTAVLEIGRVLAPNGVVLLTFDPPDTDDDLLADTEVLSDGTLRFFRGKQVGMLFRRYMDKEIKSLLGEKRIVSYKYTDDGTRIIVCHYGKLEA